MMKFLALFLAIAVAFANASHYTKGCSTIIKTATKYYTVPVEKTKFVYSTYVSKVPDYYTTYTKVAHPYKHVTSRCDYGVEKYHH